MQVTSSSLYYITTLRGAPPTRARSLFIPGKDHQCGARLGRQIQRFLFGLLMIRFRGCVIIRVGGGRQSQADRRYDSAERAGAGGSGDSIGMSCEAEGVSKKK
jgi:hypothetical protein